MVVIVVVIMMVLMAVMMLMAVIVVMRMLVVAAVVIVLVPMLMAVEVVHVVIVVLLLQLHSEVAHVKSRLAHPADAGGKAGQRQTFQHPIQSGAIRSQVQQGSHGHIAADAPFTLEIQSSHCAPSPMRSIWVAK
jgi:Na+/alanine symporter